MANLGSLEFGAHQDLGVNQDQKVVVVCLVTKESRGKMAMVIQVHQASEDLLAFRDLLDLMVIQVWERLD